MPADKASIRKIVLPMRDALSLETRRAKDEKIKEKLLALPEFMAAHKILLYASFRSEVNTFDLLKYCIVQGKITVLPKVDRENRELMLYEIKDINELAAGCFGIPEPSVNEDRRMRVEEMDLIIVPGAAFDENCNRLGYGKGFYDKLLTKAKGERQMVKAQTEMTLALSRWPLAFIIALAYEEQIVEYIPSEPYDIKMDKIITDERIIECRDK